MIIKKKVTNIASRFIKLAKSSENQRAVAKIKKELENFQLGIFRIVVVGEIKKGKSSFINALLGVENLLPAFSDVATSTVFKVMYGKERKIKVFMLPEDPEKPQNTPPPLEINEDQVKEYGTEDGNPNNEKRVDFIGIQLPNPMLASGVVIIDTPGLGGLFKKHRDITWKYVPSADAVFFVFDSVESVATKDEMDMLEKLRKLSPALFFVQTKIDLVENDHWQQWNKRNLDIISDKLNIRANMLIYFPISSKLKLIADKKKSIKHLERSGYGKLLQFLNKKLIPKKEQYLAKKLLFNISVETSSLYGSSNEHLKISLMKSSEELDKLELEFNQAKEKFDQWKFNELKEVTQLLDQKFGEIKRNTKDNYLDRLDPSPNSPIVADQVLWLESSDLSAKEIVEDADNIINNCLDQCLDHVLELQSEFNSEVGNVINEASKAIGKTIPVDDSDKPLVLETKTINNLKQTGDYFETGRHAFFGAMAGSSIGYIGAGIASLLFPPIAVAGGLAAIGGFLFGGYKGLSSSRNKNREAVIKQLQSLLSDTVRKIQSKGLRQFDWIASETEKNIRTELNAAVIAVENDLANKIKQIQQTRNKSKAEIEQNTKRLKEISESAEGILRDINQMINEKPATALAK